MWRAAREITTRRKQPRCSSFGCSRSDVELAILSPGIGCGMRDLIAPSPEWKGGGEGEGCAPFSMVEPILGWALAIGYVPFPSLAL